MRGEFGRDKVTKPIRLSAHARMQLSFRGVKEKEIIKTIRSEEWKSVELGRLECQKDFIFNNKWNGRLFEIKRVRPIFVEEESEIVVVTVYTYFIRKGD